MNRKIELIVKDPGHLVAHRQEFLLPPDAVLNLVKDFLARVEPQLGNFNKYAFRAKKAIGTSGLRRVWPWTKGDYWAPRPGRAILSHLIKARRKPCKTLCVWGEWESETRFVLHTVYPGLPAPREIHDPQISPAELPAALRFWATHAIIAAET